MGEHKVTQHAQGWAWIGGLSSRLVLQPPLLPMRRSEGKGVLFFKVPFPFATCRQIDCSKTHAMNWFLIHESLNQRWS